MRLIILLISTCFSFFTYAQADLVLSSASFEPLAINRGDVLTTFATVTNTGNTTAGANYLFVYYSTDQTIAAEEIISRVAVPALAPGESHDVTFYYPTAATLPTGDHFIALEVDPFNDVPESNEENLFCAGTGPSCGTFTVLPGGSLGGQRFVYPVLFIHGLNGNSKTWNEFGSELQRELGWVYGGRLDYCLNPDNDQTTSDGNILSFVDPEQLGLGDFYTLNFDINASGDLFVSDDGIPFNNFESNQSAIVKQGWAVRDAVGQIMQSADVDRVIIVGHSMGGLAGRQYLTNPELWQDDGDHHIAKLMTVGTPHGGSNLNSGGLGSIFTGIDESSEATRDLRYQSLFFNGQFLDGGFESAVSSFYNDDVNANGVVGRLLIISLIATPIALMFPKGRVSRWLIRNRRFFGVAAFVYTLLHTVFYALEYPLGQLVNEFADVAILTGWIAFFIFIPLTITSTDAAVRKMGPAWKKLQRWVYLAAIMAFAHWALLGLEHGGMGGALAHFVPVMLLQVYRTLKQRRLSPRNI